MPSWQLRCWPRAALALGSIVVVLGCSDAAPDVPKQSTPIDAATAGKIRAVVSYAGAVPPPREVNMQSAPACAKGHAEPVLDESLIVRDGRLVNAVVWIKSGLDKYVFAPPAKAVAIDQVGCQYKPHVVSTMVHQPVEFINSDSEAHNVHGKPKIVSGWNFIMSRKGATEQVTFPKSEVAVPVGCDIHPWMRSYIAISPNPYHGVTGESGTVELSNVPPGEYVLAVWHEKLGTMEQSVQLQASATAEATFALTAKQ